MIYCVDIDGTLCSSTYGKYEEAVPFEAAIVRVNALYDAGHRIILFTARGTTTGLNWRKLTEEQLESWGVKYHELILGKPEADVFVDDRALGPTTWAQIGFAEETLSSAPANRLDENSVFRSKDYLDLTYSPEKAPLGSYPRILAGWLHRRIYKHCGRLLDLGCGRGDHLEAFASLGFEVAGVDISPSAVAVPKEGQVRMVDLEHEPLPFPHESFDFVFSKSVVEHMRQPHKLLSKAFCALKPGGIAVIMTPSWRHTYWGPFYIDHTHVTPFTAPSLTDALSMAGFESVQVTHFRQLPLLWKLPFLEPLSWLVALLPIPYRPFSSAPWPEVINKFIRFSKEIMLLGVGHKPRGKSNRSHYE